MIEHINQNESVMIFKKKIRKGKEKQKKRKGEIKSVFATVGILSTPTPYSEN